MTTQKQTQLTTQEQIIEQIRINSKITRGEPAERIGLTSDGIKYHLKKMIESGVITRVGVTRGGYWKVDS